MNENLEYVCACGKPVPKDKLKQIEEEFKHYRQGVIDQTQAITNYPQEHPEIFAPLLKTILGRLSGYRCGEHKKLKEFIKSLM